MKTVKQVAPLLAAIVVLLAVFRFWVPQFLSLDNLLDLAQQISINAVLAFGMTLVILIGGIDLSVGAVVALIGTLTVWLLPRVGLGGAVSAGLIAATIAIAAVVVGGTSFAGGVGTMPGTFLGAIIIGILDKGLNQAGVHFSLQYIVRGLIILSAVYLDVQRRSRRQ